MLGFPPPYPEELLYSTIARSGTHDGETSPKQLLDQVFSNRKVIATVDLPSHVQAVADQYPKKPHLDTQSLIRRHTLWPIYAPFLPSERVTQLRHWMANSSQGAAHLACGVAASRVKANNKLFVCPECLKEQLSYHGENYWKRLWQTPLIKVCLQHGALHATNIKLDGEHRHVFIAVEEAEILGAESITHEDKTFAQQAEQLLLIESDGISFAQWTVFYKQLAFEQDFINSSKVDHAKIHQAILQFWGKCWLEGTSLLPSGTETSWLRALFRKHRKSFSFAEHIVAVTALSDGAVSICDVIEKASSIAANSKIFIEHRDRKSLLTPENKLSSDQVLWQRLLKDYSPKSARKHNPALYARLYRNHHDWLLSINSLFPGKSLVINKRVDWSQRDWQIARELRRICENLADDLNAPHLSRTFLIHQLDQRATVEKNLHRLPRCSQLLSLYSEGTTEYQARRLTRAYLAMLSRRQEIKRWSLLREAGLSDERMTDTVVVLLKEILSEQK